MRLFLWGHHSLIESRNRDDGSLARYGASTGDLRICASDHFLNPLVGLLIEIPMTGILFLNCRKSYMGTISNCIESILQSAKKILGISL